MSEQYPHWFRAYCDHDLRGYTAEQIAGIWLALTCTRQICGYCNEPVNPWDAAVAIHPVFNVLYHARCVENAKSERAARELARVAEREAMAEERRQAARERERNRRAVLAGADAELVARTDEFRERISPKRGACEILKAHGELLADDPERLSTSFMRQMMRRKKPCKDEDA